ncbi:MAG: DUF1071 domain-containing protein [bacterium]|nr:DUF1071 domain-containing protein [bacterium]
MNFEELYKTDVTKHIEKKGRFSYLSWPYAVAEFRKACPNGTWTIADFDYGKPYCKTDAGCFVEVAVCPDMEIPAISFTQVHPVLDNKNQTVQDPNAFQINTSIQRCLVKAIALATGIGLHIYAGEDLPTDEKPQPTLTSAHYEEQIDKIGTLEELAAWRTSTEGEIKDTLSKGEKNKLTRYYKSVKEILQQNRPETPGDLPL